MNLSKAELVFAIIVGLLFISVCYFTINYGVNKHEINECLKWKEEAEKYPDYWLTDYQREQCEYHGIEL